MKAFIPGLKGLTPEQEREVVKFSQGKLLFHWSQLLFYGVSFLSFFIFYILLKPNGFTGVVLIGLSTLCAMALSLILGQPYYRRLNKIVAEWKKEHLDE